MKVKVAEIVCRTNLTFFPHFIFIFTWEKDVSLRFDSYRSNFTSAPFGQKNRKYQPNCQLIRDLLFFFLRICESSAKQTHFQLDFTSAGFFLSPILISTNTIFKQPKMRKKNTFFWLELIFIQCQ